MEQEYKNAYNLPLKEKIKVYNKLISRYTAETGDKIKLLTGCGSCVKNFEEYQPFKNWICSIGK